MDKILLLAFALTLLAGLATCLGGIITFFAKRTNTKLLSIALGFSAGVMIYVSMVEILPDSKIALIGFLGETKGELYAVIAFFVGVLMIALIDHFIPSFENPHTVHNVEEIKNKKKAEKFRKLHRLGVFTAVAITLHNFPEGLATFASTLSDPSLGIVIAFAIAIHNIPEGIAVSVPIFYSTGSKKKAFLYSFISGIAEPVGAVFGYLILGYFFNQIMLGILFALVAGIMMYVSLDELLPAAQKWGKHHLSMYGMIAGMIVMAISLLLFS